MSIELNNRKTKRRLTVLPYEWDLPEFSQKLRIIWELLRRNRQYIKDFETWKKKPSVKGFESFIRKWHVGYPIDPQMEFDPQDHFIAIGLGEFIDQAVTVINNTARTLHVVVNLNYSDTRIKKEFEKIIITRIEGKGKPIQRNLFKKIFPRLENIPYYDRIFFVYDQREKGISWGQIVRLAKQNKIKEINNSDNVRNLHKAFQELQRRFSSIT